jgi:plasmid maintenance system antidote protein VapI
MARFDPDYVVPTAEVLKEWLEENGLSVGVAVACLPREDRELAAGYLENVLADKQFTERTGEVLARVTGISLAFWMNFEHNYRTGLAAGKKAL